MLHSEILTIQHWFASAITKPLDDEIQDAEIYITPNSKLTPSQRIQIYNEQYWWRLLTILQKNFPTLARLFGYTDFNTTIGFPFLSTHISNHWSLAKLGEKLSQWIDEHYTAKDKPLILAAAEIDWAFQELFLVEPPTPLQVSLELLTTKLTLQNHVKLFAFSFDIFSFRQELLKEEVEYWEENDFPPLFKARKYHYILWRNPHNQLQFKEIEEGQWTLLQLISDGFTIEEASEFLEKKGGRLYEEALCSFQDWIQGWVQQKFLKEKK